MEMLEHHLDDEEGVVFPALEKLIDDKTKELILVRYRGIGDELDELERLPLISLADMDNGSTSYDTIENLPSV
jgi:hypothetical protein